MPSKRHFFQKMNAIEVMLSHTDVSHICISEKQQDRDAREVFQKIELYELQNYIGLKDHIKVYEVKVQRIHIIHK